MSLPKRRISRARGSAARGNMRLVAPPSWNAATAGNRSCPIGYARSAGITAASRSETEKCVTGAETYQEETLWTTCSRR